MTMTLSDEHLTRVDDDDEMGRKMRSRQQLPNSSPPSCCVDPAMDSLYILNNCNVKRHFICKKSNNLKMALWSTEGNLPTTIAIATKRIPFPPHCELYLQYRFPVFWLQLRHTRLIYRRSTACVGIPNPYRTRSPLFLVGWHLRGALHGITTPVDGSKTRQAARYYTGQSLVSVARTIKRMDPRPSGIVSQLLDGRKVMSVACTVVKTRGHRIF
jgi:hypothetical protein